VSQANGPREKPEYPIRATLAGVLLFVIGLAIAGGTVISVRRDRERRDAWIAAAGTVVDVLPGPPGGSSRPVVTFSTAEGERIRFTPTGWTGWRTPGTGETVPVIYPVGLPEQARIDPRALRWTRTGIAAGAALLLMALGGYIAWHARIRGLQ
jgi:hypothetical protein